MEKCERFYREQFRDESYRIIAKRAVSVQWVLFLSQIHAIEVREGGGGGVEVGENHKLHAGGPGGDKTVEEGPCVHRGAIASVVFHDVDTFWCCDDEVKGCGEPVSHFALRFAQATRDFLICLSICNKRYGVVFVFFDIVVVEVFWQ